ncbi:MAG TPA: RNA methyltransferase, partial [Anaerolineales bacterium]
IVKLRENKRQRVRGRLMLVEGWDELNLALASGMLPEAVLMAPELTTLLLEGSISRPLTVSRTVFEKISYRENPDGWLGIFPIPERSLEDIQLSASPLVIIAESVEKPGNLGAILRTADAASVDALLVSDPRADLWNPNVVRASRGAIFTVPAVEVGNTTALDWLRSRKIEILAATPSATMPYTQVDLTKPIAIAVGTEDEGLTDFWLSNAEQKVLIPMSGRVNSLNVSIATALIVYEAIRQRKNS